MNASERQRQIVEYVNDNSEVSFADIKELFPDYSEMTIRRDIDALSKRNQIIRVFGGVKSIGCLIRSSEDEYMKRNLSNVGSKIRIAQKALALLQPDTSVFLGSGSTIMQLAKIFPNGKYFVTTDGLNSAMELSSLGEVSILMLGGSVNKNSYCVNGSIATQQLHNMNFNIAFLGASGVDLDSGFYTSVAEDYLLRRQIVARSEKTAILFDSSKVGQKGIYSFAKAEDVDYVISDDELSPEMVAAFSANGVAVL